MEAILSLVMVRYNPMGGTEKGAGRDAIDLFEDAGEVIRVHKAGCFGHLLDERPGSAEQVSRVAHLQSEQHLTGRFAPISLKEAAKVRSVDVAGFGDVVQRVQHEKATLDQLAAALVGLLRGRFRVVLGKGVVGHMEDQQFEQACADRLCVVARVAPVLLQTREKFMDL